MSTKLFVATLVVVRWPSVVGISLPTGGQQLLRAAAAADVLYLFSRIILFFCELKSVMCEYMGKYLRVNRPYTHITYNRIQ